jgi:hypothetical protein
LKMCGARMGYSLLTDTRSELPLGRVRFSGCVFSDAFSLGEAERSSHILRLGASAIERRTSLAGVGWSRAFSVIR